jgi:hypothetical protein
VSDENSAKSEEAPAEATPRQAQLPADEAAVPPIAEQAFTAPQVPSPPAEAALPGPPPGGSPAGVGQPPPPPPPITAHDPMIPLQFRPRRVRPVLGPALWIAGMALWTQIIVGTFVIVKDMPEPIAVLFILATVVAGWVLSVRLRQDTSRFRFRHFAPILVAPLVWAVALFLVMMTASVVGGGAGVTVLLWLVAIGALLLGRRFSGPPRQEPTLLHKVLSTVAVFSGTILAMGVLVMLASKL